MRIADDGSAPDASVRAFERIMKELSIAANGDDGRPLARRTDNNSINVMNFACGPTESYFRLNGFAYGQSR